MCDHTEEMKQPAVFTSVGLSDVYTQKSHDLEGVPKKRLFASLWL